MKYKVGDKVKVRNDLKVGNIYGIHAFMCDMNGFRGKIVTIKSTHKRDYRIEEGAYWWTDEMLEPVEEMSAKEATRILGEICCGHQCITECPISMAKGKMACQNFRRDKPKEVLEILKQWKADHEKKPIETEFIDIVRVIEDTDDTKKCVYEEEIPYSEDLEEAQVRVLKEYCKNHDGKFFAVMENICRVKE